VNNRPNGENSANLVTLLLRKSEGALSSTCVQRWISSNRLSKRETPFEAILRN
jgi:hypothetical protein